MDKQEIRERILKIRNAIRKHRDQEGHDRCWLDDWDLYEVALGIQKPLLLDFHQCMHLCEQYHRDRHAFRPQHFWMKRKKNPDYSLDYLNIHMLAGELARLISAVAAHRAIGDGRRTAKDDRKLYAVLPDRIPADQRLPSKVEFMPRCDLHISAQFVRIGKKIIR